MKINIGKRAEIWVECEVENRHVYCHTIACLREPIECEECIVHYEYPVEKLKNEGRIKED